MKTLRVEKALANLARLDQEIRAILGEQRAFGSSLVAGAVETFVADDVTEEEETAVLSVLESHDPDILSPEQQKELDRIAAIQDARRTIASTPIDLTAYASDLPRIRLLAAKVKWLEYELRNLVRELRGAE